MLTIIQLIQILIYLYIISMFAVLAYYVTLFIYGEYIAKTYNAEIENYSIEWQEIFFMFCPLVNTIAAVALWLPIRAEMQKVKYIIIMSTYPDFQDPPEDEDI